MCFLEKPETKKVSTTPLIKRPRKESATEKEVPNIAVAKTISDDHVITTAMTTAAMPTVIAANKVMMRGFWSKPMVITENRDPRLMMRSDDDERE